MDEILNNLNNDDETLSLIEKMMSILDEDGQPIYSLEWLQEYFGITDKEILK